MRMIGVFGGMTDFTGTVCVFKGGNCLRQLDFLQFPLLTNRSKDQLASRPRRYQPAGSNAQA